MKIEIAAVGGYSEVGKNMTAVRVDDEVVMLDMGFEIQKLMDHEETHGQSRGYNTSSLRRMGAIPNDNTVSSWRNKTKAIALSHCHMDHIGAVPYLEENYRAPIVGTPFTIEVLNNTTYDDHHTLQNATKKLQTGHELRISKNLSLEFIHVTHSTPQTAIVALHTKKGAIVYANDFKLDNHPVLGKKPDYKRLKELGNEGVIALIVNSLYSSNDASTPSESIARQLLKDVMFTSEHQSGAMIGTCFASHMARLRSFIDCARKIDRKVIMFGRSMNKYVSAAEQAKLVQLSKEAEIIVYRDKVRKRLAKLKKEDLRKYLILCTGGQGEPNAILSRMLKRELPFKFASNDTVIFSNKVIPVEPNITRRATMEKRLKKLGVRIFKNVHVSGHGSREDHRDLINMLQPEHVIPTHGTKKLIEPLTKLTKDMGYASSKTHLIGDAKKVKIRA